MKVGKREGEEGEREGKTDPQMVEQKSLTISYICLKETPSAA